MLTFPVCHSSGGGVDVLDSVISSVCCDLDATISASYGGSGQTWANLIASPADGAAQTDYDFFLGADGDSSTDDPAFNVDTFDLDGTDVFVGKITNTPTLAGLSRTDGTNVWWIATVTHIAALLSADFFFEVRNGTTFGNQILIRTKDNTGTLRVAQRGSATVNVDFAGVLTADTDHLIIVSADVPNNNIRLWVNTTTKTTASPAFNTSTADATFAASLAGRNPSGNHLPNGSKYKHFSCGNAFIDDADAALIFAHLEARHGKDYTP